MALAGKLVDAGRLAEAGRLVGVGIRAAGKTAVERDDTPVGSQGHTCIELEPVRRDRARRWITSEWQCKIVSSKFVYLVLEEVHSYAKTLAEGLAAE